MKKILFVLLVAFTSCQKQDFNLLVSYNELVINEVEKTMVVIYKTPTGEDWTSYRTDNKKVIEKARALITEEAKEVVVDIFDNEIVGIEKK